MSQCEICAEANQVKPFTGTGNTMFTSEAFTAEVYNALAAICMKWSDYVEKEQLDAAIENFNNKFWND